MRPNLLKIRGLLITLSHLMMILISFTLAFWIRYEFSASILQSPLLLASLAIIVPIKLLTFGLSGLQKGWWRYAGLPDLVRIFLANMAASIACEVVLFMWLGREFPDSIAAIDFLICFLLTAGSRFVVRLYNETLKLEAAGKGEGILILGAGGAGR